MDMAGQAQVDPVFFQKFPHRPAAAPEAEERPVPHPAGRRVGDEHGP